MPYDFGKKFRNFYPKKNWIELNDEKECTIEENDTAGYINDYFTNIGENLAKHLDSEWKFEGVTNNTTSLEDIDIKENGTDEYMNNVITSKSSAVDGVNSEILKN